jgi:hypothetical protein
MGVVRVVSSAPAVGVAAAPPTDEMSFWVEWGLGDRAVVPSAADVMTRLEAAEAETTRLVRAQARDLQLLRSVRVAQQEADLGADAPHASVDADGWVATEAGLALGLSETQVRAARVRRRAGPVPPY